MLTLSDLLASASSAMLRASLPLSAFLVLLLAGCGGSAPDLGPPAGWSADGLERWWQDGVDTAAAFRDLETFEGMALGERPDGKRPEGPVHRNVQQQFLPLYRNQPEVLDSLFTEIAVPMIDEGGRDEERDQLVRAINRALNRVFVFPRPSPDSEVAIPYPDSLRTAGIGGSVKMQVYLDAEGTPLAIKRVDAVHPTLDAVALRATTQKRWLPATLDGEPIPSWVRSVIKFNPQP